MIRWKNANWLFVASLFTTAYLLFVIFWVGPSKIITFTKTDELNAIGDFLAGIFSPLAFIWLVAAVLTQRQELTDTRDQFAENQKVVDAQLKTINEQSGLLQQQHTLAEETARKTYRLSLFEQRYRLYSDFVSLGNRYKSGHFDSAYSEMVELTARSSFVFSIEIQNWFASIENAIDTLIEDKQRSMREENDTYGNQWWVINTPDDQERCDLQEEWIREQFTVVAQRSQKFEGSMTISDD